jgi:hypothetical protein
MATGSLTSWRQLIGSLNDDILPAHRLLSPNSGRRVIEMSGRPIGLATILLSMKPRACPMRATDTPAIPHTFDGDFRNYEQNYFEVQKLDENFSVRWPLIADSD